MDEVISHNSEMHTTPKWMKPSEALSREFSLPKIESLRGDELSEEIDIVRFGFSISGINFLIPTDVMCQTMAVPTIYNLPNTSTCLRGVVNIRGNFVPVFDIPHYLSLNHATEKEYKLFVIGENEESVGILIENLPGKYTFKAPERLAQLPPLPNILRGNVISAYSRNNETWLDIDREKFLYSLAGSKAINKN